VSTKIVADKRLTPIGLGRKLVLCIQVIFAPGTMLAAELKDNEARKAFLSPGKPPHVAYIVRRAFWTALGVVVGAIFLGLIVDEFSEPSSKRLLLR
jgi:ABC-type Fe3+ transport system permease subunit